MMYKHMMANKTYNNTPVLVLPKDVFITNEKKEKIPQKFIFVMLADTLEGSISLLSSPSLYLPMRNLKVTRCYMPTKIMERFGNTMINDNLKNSIFMQFKDGIKEEFPTLKPIDTQGFISLKHADMNIVYNAAPELEYFMKYRYRKSVLSQVQTFFSFLNKRMEAFDSKYDNHMRIFYVPLDIWTKKAVKGFGYGKDSMDNPLSFLLAALYYDEEIINSINGDFRFLIHDRTRNQSLYITKDMLTKRKLNELKRQLAKFDQFEFVESTDHGISEIDTPSNTLSNPTNDKEVKQKLEKEILKEVKKKLTHNFVGDTPLDVLADSEFDDTSDELDQIEEDEISEEIQEILNGEDLTDTKPETDTNILEDRIQSISDEVVSNRRLKAYMPKRKVSKDEKLIAARREHAKELFAAQEKVIITPDRVEMMTIDELDTSNVVKASNPEVTKSKYVNFDRNYVDKKLDFDIDHAVMSLNNATNQIFIKEKHVEDTSDIETQKYTYTYILEDERGKEHKIVLDLPKVIEGSRLRINGNNKTIQKQLTLLPIVKDAPDRVIVTSWYNKLFMYREGKNINTPTTGIKKFLLTKSAIDKYKVVISNCYMKNKKFNTTLEYDSYAKNMESIKYGKKEIYFNTQLCLDTLKGYGVDVKKIDLTRKLPLGYDKENKLPILIDLDSNQSVTKYLIDEVLESSDYDSIQSSHKGSAKTNAYTKIKIYQKFIPLGACLLYFEGLTTLCEKAKITSYFYANEKEMKEDGIYNPLTYGKIQLADGIFVWRNDRMDTSLLMSGLLRAPLEGFTREELDDKDTLISLISYYYDNENKHKVLDQFYEFMIDNNTKMILEDLGLPTQISDVLIYGNSLLADNKHSFEFSAENCRVRSMEIISSFAYEAITDAYGKHRSTLSGKRPKAISVNRNAVLRSLSTERLVEEASSLNPIMDLEKNRALTPKGPQGVNLDESYSIGKRIFPPDMIGIMGISSSPDANVGKVKQLTYEPKITSTMGYLEPCTDEELDNLRNVNLLTASELLSPPGVLHDDGPRTSMAFKQSKFMVPVPNASPVIIGNKVESAIAYQVSDDFVFKAKEKGKVIDIKEGFVVVQYESGKKEAIDLGKKVMKNSSNGFWIESEMKSRLKKGDTFDKNEILALDERWFKYNHNDKGASMCIGTLCNIAILINYDLYEDSIPITQEFAEKMKFDVVEEQSFNIGKNAFVQSFPKVGDEVRIADPLVLYDKSFDDPIVNKMLNAYRDLFNENTIQSNMSSIKSEHSGVITKIEIICTCDLDELSPSLRTIVEDHYNTLGKRISVLDKHKNKDDVDSYKCGQVLVEVPEKVETKYGKVKGKYVGDGIRVSVYVKKANIAKKGDKLASFTALKGIISDVIPKGYEPIALETGTKIDASISPLAILARKTPSILIAMFGNKCMIEITKQMREFWLNN